MTEEPMTEEDFLNVRTKIVDGEEMHRCVNWELCHMNPQIIHETSWWPKYFHTGIEDSPLCTACHREYGTWGEQNGKGILEFKDAECPVCLEYTRSVSMPFCDHFVCVQCFHRMHHPPTHPQPEFPIPELEEEYTNHEEDDNLQEFLDKLPQTTRDLLIEWDLQVERALDLDELMYENESNLRACPVCRAKAIYS